MHCINLRLPTHGGLFAWEFEKRDREVKVRVEGPARLQQLQLRLRAGAGGLRPGLHARRPSADACRERPTRAGARGLVPAVSGLPPLLPKPPAAVARLRRAASMRCVISASLDAVLARSWCFRHNFTTRIRMASAIHPSALVPVPEPEAVTEILVSAIRDLRRRLRAAPQPAVPSRRAVRCRPARRRPRRSGGSLRRMVRMGRIGHHDGRRASAGPPLQSGRRRASRSRPPSSRPRSCPTGNSRSVLTPSVFGIPEDIRDAPRPDPGWRPRRLVPPGISARRHCIPCRLISAA